MKTANEMYSYCIENNFGKGWNEKWALKHFSIIEAALQRDEAVKICFMGLHNYQSPTEHSGNFAYAITNKRLIFAQKGVLSRQTMQSILINMINDVSYSSGYGPLSLGIITFNTIKTRFNVGCDKEQGMKLLSKIQVALDEQKNSNAQVFQSSSADEILKYKQLLDMGAITQEEFEKKKKELLNNNL